MTVARLTVVFLAAGFGASAAAATAAAPSAGGAAELGPTWRNWAYSRPITIGAETVKHRLVRVPVSEEVYARANIDLSDLRVIDDSGYESGHVLSPGAAAARFQWRDTELLDTGYVVGSHSQAVVDTGEDDAVHNLLEIALVDRDEEFFSWVELSASSDYETWRTVRVKAPVYSFKEIGQGQALRVTYPETRDRWLRLRLRREREVSIATIRVSERIEDDAELVPANPELSLREDSPDGESWWEFRSQQSPAPISAVDILTRREEFHRPIKVSISNDGDSWSTIGRGQVYRFSGLESEAREARESLQVKFSARSARFWRVTVLDRDDAPIGDLRITLLRPVRSFVFRPEAGRTYRLVYGNSRVAAPRYEISDLLTLDQQAAAPLGALGAEEENPAFVSSEPFSERHPLLIWGALGLAVLVLASMAVKSLR